jgi:hypothetical protein
MKFKCLMISGVRLTRLSDVLDPVLGAWGHVNNVGVQMGICERSHACLHARTVASPRTCACVIARLRACACARLHVRDARV